ncbi:protein Vhl [Anopheles stephensi]|uniref:VHL domain-containing protein n=1 Tax=Anopheles stephensi TaxID=30069 RepID=A0A182YHL1_ANOST|nr:protein Vhl [Anopheles stephensi]
MAATNAEPVLRSRNSEVRSFVLFRNTTERVVDVYWVNYSATLTHYSTLQPGAQCKVNTFVSHPWLFKDKRHEERMHVRHQPIFMPEPWYNSFTGAGRLNRMEARIHFPVRTLKENCLWRILALLSAKEESVLCELELPNVLVQELVKRKRNRV